MDYNLIKEKFILASTHYDGDLEEDKWVKIEGWENEEQAKIEITNSIIRYQENEAH